MGNSLKAPLDFSPSNSCQYLRFLWRRLNRRWNERRNSICRRTLYFLLLKRPCNRTLKSREEVWRSSTDPQDILNFGRLHIRVFRRRSVSCEVLPLSVHHSSGFLPLWPNHYESAPESKCNDFKLCVCNQLASNLIVLNPNVFLFTINVLLKTIDSLNDNLAACPSKPCPFSINLTCILINLVISDSNYSVCAPIQDSLRVLQSIWILNGHKNSLSLQIIWIALLYWSLGCRPLPASVRPLADLYMCRVLSFCRGAPTNLLHWPCLFMNKGWSSWQI